MEIFMKQEQIDRINALAHKQKSVGLTEEEKVEQAKLRKEYLDAVKGSLRAHLNNIDIKEKDGSITNLGEKYGRKEEKSKSINDCWCCSKFCIWYHRTNGIFLYVHCTNVILISFYYGWYLFHADVSFRSYCRKYWGRNY